VDKENVIPLEDALNVGFESSTRDELVFYCETLGLDTVDPRGDLDKIKDALFSALGHSRPGVSQRTTARAIPRSPVIPPVNLTPFGRWGGARRRIMLPRPEGAKHARAEGFGWNGKATYWLPYDELVAVPYPIYAILLDTKRPRAKTIPIGTAGEFTTAWDHNTIPFTDKGEDPITANLPRSMTEWYQEKGPEFYEKLGARDLRTVATNLEVPTTDQDRRQRPHDDILSDVMIFLFGYVPSSERAEETEAT